MRRGNGPLDQLFENLLALRRRGTARISQDAVRADRAPPPVRSAGINADSGLWLPGTASSSRTWSGARCSNSEVLLIGDADVRLGDLYVDGIAPVPVYISRPQFAAWEHTHLTIDAVPGRGAGFSLEAPEGVRFLTRSRLLTDEERRVEVF